MFYEHTRSGPFTCLILRCMSHFLKLQQYDACRSIQKILPFDGQLLVGLFFLIPEKVLQFLVPRSSEQRLFFKHSLSSLNRTQQTVGHDLINVSQQCVDIRLNHHLLEYFKFFLQNYLLCISLYSFSLFSELFVLKENR